MIRLKGYTNWAIGLCCADIVRAIVKNKRTIQPVSCFVKVRHAACHVDTVTQKEVWL